MPPAKDPPRLVSIHRRAKPSLLASEPRLSKAPRPTPERPLIVSASELRDFLTCRVKWHWRYQAQLEPQRQSPNLGMGSLAHAILDQYYQMPAKSRTVERMTRIANAEVRKPAWLKIEPDDRKLINAMTIGYASWSRDADAEIGLTDCAPEEKFALNLTDDGSIRVHGRIDNRFAPAVLKKTMAVVEFKTASQIKLDRAELSNQVTVYLWALRKLYPKFKRYIAYYTVLRKQMPGPRVKADLFAREPIERTDEQLDQWEIDTRHQALDMLDAAVYPNYGDHCNWMCDFKHACAMRGSGPDLEFVLKSQFKTREYK